ncbi:MAG: hypothetical protein U0N66_06180, partial [Blautia sp.]
MCTILSEIIFLRICLKNLQNKQESKGIDGEVFKEKEIWEYESKKNIDINNSKYNDCRPVL